MGKSSDTVTVYSTEQCKPCTALKLWLRQRGVAFREVSIHTLDDQRRSAIAKNILSVSRLDQPTVPAVCITRDGQEQWVSNHGKRDITEMVKEIGAILGI